MLCRAMSRPTAALMDAALRVLAYLNKHKDVGLRYQCDSQNRLRGYCEAELMAATEAAKEAVHLRRLHAELTFEDNPPPTRLHLDNMGAIDTAYNHAHHSRMKHCDRKVFLIRELVEDHKIV